MSKLEAGARVWVRFDGSVQRGTISVVSDEGGYLTGTDAGIAAFGKRVGQVVRASHSSDVLTLALGLLVGALLGAIPIPFGKVSITFGAAAVLIASEEWAEKWGIPVQAYLGLGRTSAVDFVQGEGLLMAPTVAVSDLLEQTGLALQDFDYYEIHEAFAAQVLATLKAWESEDYCRLRLGRSQALGSIDRAKLNVKGSSIAFGHPFAATGARIIAVLAKLLHDESGRRGLISVCTAGGMGVAAIVEGKGS